MRIHNELELFAFYIYNYLQKNSLADIGPEEMCALVKSFTCLTILSRANLALEMEKSDWYL